MGFDQYGFPVAMLANSILLDQKDYGDSAKNLENAWLDWLHFAPFDAPVAARLASLMRERLARLNKEKDGERNEQLLKRKLQLVARLATRYDMQRFVQ